MFCPKCGTQLEVFEVFCHSCGHRMTEEPHTSSQEPAPAEQAAPLVETPVQPKKKSKKKLIIGITAAVTALAVGIGAVAFYLVRNPKVYLRTKITEYDKNGDWARTVEYQYNDQGSPTEIKTTNALYQEVERVEQFNGFEMILYDYVPNGKKNVNTISYEYNDQGYCIYSGQTKETYDADGSLIEREQQDTGGCEYEYNDDGTIDEVRMYSFDDNYKLRDDFSCTMRYHYDDDGRLFEITQHYDISSNNSQWESVIFDFRYDSKGRLAASCCRRLESAELYEYEYDKDGNLERVSLSMAPCQAPIDDRHTVEEMYPKADFTLYREAEFEYDSKGRLISREVFDGEGNALPKIDLEYDSKFINRIEFEEGVVHITDDEDEADRIAEDMNENDSVLVRDKHGNITKIICSDGSYTEYEYEEVRLKKNYAQQHESMMYCLDNVDITGKTPNNLYLGVQTGFLSCVFFPTNELYEIEVLSNARY